METNTDQPKAAGFDLAALSLTDLKVERPLGPDGKPVSAKRLSVIREDKIVGRGTDSVIDRMSDADLLEALNRQHMRSYSDALRWARAAHRYFVEQQLKAARSALKAQPQK